MGSWLVGWSRGGNYVATHAHRYTAVHTSVLGALLTFSSALWYPAYVGYAGLSALEDQQLGGLIMWVPGGAVFLAAAIAVPLRATARRRAACMRAQSCWTMWAAKETPVSDSSGGDKAAASAAHPLQNTHCSRRA